MSPAQPKRYYTVKEASDLLGVSTNTIYTYLKEGQLVGKRIGRGRFKIPYKVLAPFIEEGSAESQANSTQVLNKSFATNEIKRQTVDSFEKVMPEDASGFAGESNELSAPLTKFEETREVREFRPQILESTESTEEETAEPAIQTDPGFIKSGVNDIIFFRIFKGITFLGLGIIYLFSASLLFSFEGTFLENIGSPFLKVLPYALVVTGIFNLIEVVRPAKFEKFHLLVDSLSVLVLGYFSFITITTGEYGLFTFTASFCAVAISHLISGVKGELKTSTFFSSFSKYSLLLAIIGGIVVTLYPRFFPLQNISEYINQNKGFFAFVWFSLLAAPLVYLLSPYGKKSGLKLPFFVLASTMTLIVATQLTFQAKWDTSYVSYLTGIFGIFLAWWVDSRKELDTRRLWIPVTSFIWVSVSLIFGLYALNAQRLQIKSTSLANMQDTLEKSVAAINSNFDKRSSVLTEYAGKEELREVVKGKDADIAIAQAKVIYERLGHVERVLIYNKEGIAIGVYPRNTLFQGTNFSERPYFSETLGTYRSYISPIFEDVLGTPSVIQTEPIFENNNFIGMLGVGLQLDKLASEFKVGVSESYGIKGVDKNGFLVFSSDPDSIGSRISSDVLGTDKNLLKVEQGAEIPGWRVVVTSDLTPLVAKTTDLNIILSLLLTVNAIFSVAAGVIASQRKPVLERDQLVPSVGQSPQQFSAGQSPRFV